MKKYLKIAGLLLLVWILWRTDLGQVGAVLARCRLELLLAALALNLSSIAVKAGRWQLMLRTQGFDYGLLRSIRVYFSGVFIGTATPGRVGDLARVLYVRRDLGISLGFGLSSVIMDRLMDIYMLLGVGLLACFRFGVAGYSRGVFLLPAAVLALAPLVLFSPRHGRRLVQWSLGLFQRTKLGRRVAGGVDDLYHGLSTLIAPSLIAGGLLTLLSYGGVFGAGYLGALSLHIPISAVDTALVVGLANLLSLLPITVAGLGTREAVFLYCFSVLGLDPALALGFSIVILFLFYLGSGLCGLPFFLSDRPPAQDPQG